MRPYLLFGLLLCSCSSADFVAVPPPAEDSGTDTGSADTGTDAVVPPDTTPGDVAPETPPPPCTTLGTDPPTIYVDGRATREPNGTSDCPAHTIKEGLALVAGLASGKRTIKVAGAPGGLLYDEKGALVVKFNTSIVGDDMSKVIVTGGGACLSSSECVFVMEGGTSVEGVTVDAKGARIGIAAIPGIFTAASLKSVTTTGSTGDKVPSLALAGGGVLDIGSDVHVTKNTGPGAYAIAGRLQAKTPFAGVQIQFDKNLAGIVIDGTASIDLDNVSASGNTTNGVTLLTTAKDGNTIAGLVAQSNGANGIFVEATTGLKLRRSTLVKNKIGLLFRFGPSNTLDLGTAGLFDKGGNTFGGATAANSKAGVCLPLGRTALSDAQANKWVACPPSTSSLPAESCDDATSYQDVWFNGSGSSGKPPLTFGECTVGP